MIIFICDPVLYWGVAYHLFISFIMMILSCLLFVNLFKKYSIVLYLTIIKFRLSSPISWCIEMEKIWLFPSFDDSKICKMLEKLVLPKLFLQLKTLYIFLIFDFTHLYFSIEYWILLKLKKRQLIKTEYLCCDINHSTSNSMASWSKSSSKSSYKWSKNWR